MNIQHDPFDFFLAVIQIAILLITSKCDNAADICMEYFCWPFCLGKRSHGQDHTIQGC